MNIIGFAILLLIAFVFVAMFPNALRDLAAQVRQLRKGAKPLHRSARGGYAAAEHLLATGYQTRGVRPSPGHRNFGLAPKRPALDAAAFTPFPDLR